MKLLSMHINNYGKLSNFDHIFSDGINVFCENNGYGKSTIVSFLKAMFYGLAAYKSNTVDFVDRKHFYPFDKGDFGGNVVFEYKGDHYRIERSFGEKSEKGDSLKVYCNSNPTDVLGDVPGLVVFGINSDSFERLLCIDSEKINISSTSDMNKRINNCAINAADDFDIDALTDKLKKSDSAINKDVITYKEKIKVLTTEIHNLEHEKQALDGKYSVLNDAQEKADKARELHIEAAAKAALIEKWKNYDDKIGECDALSESIKQIRSRYKKKIPDRQKTVEIKKTCESIKANTEALKASRVSEDVSQEIQRLLKTYPNGFAPDEQTAKAESILNDLENSRRDQSNLLSISQTDDVKHLEYHFGGQIPSDDRIADLERKKRHCDELSRRLQGINRTITESNVKTVTENKGSKKLCAILAVIAAAVILSGIAVFFASVVFGAVLTAIGFLILIADLFVYVNYKSAVAHVVEQEPIEKLNPEYDMVKGELDKSEAELRTELALYRYSGKDAGELLFELKNDLQNYKSVLYDQEKKENQLTQLEKKIESLNAELDEFFGAYALQGTDRHTVIDNMKADKVRFESLKKQADNSKERCDQLEKSISASEQTVSSFVKEYVLDEPFEADGVLKDIEEIDRLENQLAKRTEDAERYKADNALDKRPVSADQDISLLEKNMQDSIREVDRLEREIDEIEMKVSALDDKRAEIDELKTLKDGLLKKKEILSQVRSEIVGADQSLKDKYVKPIRDRFCYYAKHLEDTLGQKVSMDKDYSISFEIQGKLRSSKHLSDGNLSVCALCFRLAMIDSMFEGEMPFIIMDDPFVFLDSEHFSKTKELMNELSADKQIIYFCCHESRKI